MSNNTKGLTDKEFKKLMESIKKAWGEYNRLQEIYRKQIGKRYEWLK